MNPINLLSLPGLPSKDVLVSGTATSFFWITIFVIIFMVLLGGGVFVWWLIRHLQFNKKIEIFEERNNIVEWIGKDRAKELVYNIYGDSVFRLKRRKKILPRGEIKIAKNKYLYVIGPDGEWINCALESLNRRLKQVGLKPISPDMRAFKSGTAKLIKDRYEKRSFLKEHPYLIPLIMIIIVCIALYFIVDRIVASENNLIEMTKLGGEVMDKASQVLSGLNNICSTSGMTGG